MFTIVSRGILFILTHFPCAPVSAPLPLFCSPVCLCPPMALHPRKPRAKVFILSGWIILLSSLAERAISSVHNSTAGARDVWLHLYSAHLVSALACGCDTPSVALEIILKGAPRFSFGLWPWHAIGHAWHNFKGWTCVSALACVRDRLASCLTALVCELKYNFFFRWFMAVRQVPALFDSLVCELEYNFFVLLCDVAEPSKARKVLPRKQFWMPATECAWKRWQLQIF